VGGKAEHDTEGTVGKRALSPYQKEGDKKQKGKQKKVEKRIHGEDHKKDKKNNGKRESRQISVLMVGRVPVETV